MEEKKKKIKNLIMRPLGKLIKKYQQKMKACVFYESFIYHSLVYDLEQVIKKYQEDFEKWSKNNE